MSSQSHPKFIRVESDSSHDLVEQWCTGSGFWSPIRPDIKKFLDLDWMSFSLQPDPEPDYPNEKTVTMPKS